jgi:hypothetical protein
VTNQRQNSCVRRAARVLALVPAILVTTATGAAFADPPEQWDTDQGIPALDGLMVYALIPLGLFLLITLLVYVPSMSRSETYRPGEAWRGEPEWFGGPRGGVEATGKQDQPAVQGSTPDDRKGGASGGW